MRNWVHGLILVLVLFWFFLGVRLIASSQGEWGGEVASADVAQEASRSSSAGKIAPLFTEEVHFWESHILRWAGMYGLDPNLVATVMQIESCGHPTVVSRAGAVGLFQVMPYHFQAGENPRDPEVNARRGLTYLKRAWERTGGDVRLTLAAYNGGFRRLQEPEYAWPAETRRYVAWGTAIYQDALAHKERSPTLEEWLSRGGWSLCMRARVALNLGGGD